MRAEKRRGGWVLFKPALKHLKQGTQEVQYMGEFSATIAAAGYRDTKITQENAPQKKKGRSQRREKGVGGVSPRYARTKTKKENAWEQRKRRVGWVPDRSEQEQNERAHESGESRGCGGFQ